MKTFLIPFCLLTVVSNIAPSPNQVPQSNDAYSLHVSSDQLCPGSTDNLLSDITVTYSIKDPASVGIKVVRNHEVVIILVDDIKQKSGNYSITWDGRDRLNNYVDDSLYELEFYINGNKVKTIPLEVSSLIARINIPIENALVRAQVPIFGTACGRNFKKYTVEYSKKDENNWILIEESTIPEANSTQVSDLTVGDETIHGNLATWDTGLREYYYYDTDVDLSGEYTVKLTVFNQEGRAASSEVNVEVGRVISFVYGGTVESEDKKVSLKFEEHSIKTPFVLFNIKEAEKSSRDKLGIIEGYRLVSNVYEIEPEGVDFGRPATLTLCYDPKKVQNRNMLCIYVYDTDLGIWEWLASKHDSKEKVLTAEISSTQKLYSYYAIFERHKNISAPTLYKMPLETQLNLIDIYGETEAGQRVKIYINNEEQSEIVTDVKTGVFKLPNALLTIGENSITAKAIDEFGNSSPISNKLTVDVVPKNPKQIHSITLKDSNFEEDLGNREIGISDSLFIEMTGEDSDENSIDATPVLVKSSLTDPRGIEVFLLETGFNTGRYRAVVKLSNKTNAAQKILAVRNKEEEIGIVSMADRNKFASVRTKKYAISKTMLVPTELCLRQDTFEDDFDEWKNLDGEEGATLALDNEITPDKSFCLKLTNRKQGGSFGVVIKDTPYDVSEYPLINFDYKIPGDVKINFLAKVGKKWYDIQFTDDDKVYERINMAKIGRINGIIPDNNWHHAEFDLYSMLKKYTDNKIVEKLIMADYDSSGYMKLCYGHSREGAAFYIDNFVISKQLKETPASKEPQIPWEIGVRDGSNDEFLDQVYVQDNYYVGEPIEKFERAITMLDPVTNIHFFLTKEDLEKTYLFSIYANNWDVRQYKYVNFNVLLNDAIIKTLSCPYIDGTKFTIYIDKGLTEGWNVLSLKWIGGGQWITWDYLKFEPVDIRKPHSSWQIGYDDNSFGEFAHEIEVGDDYFIGTDFKKFERGVSYQDPKTYIHFMMAKEMLNTDYELLIKPLAIQPKVSGVFFKVYINDKETGIYNVAAEKKPLHISIRKNTLKEGQNTIPLEWVSGSDWITWDYLKFGPVK